MNVRIDPSWHEQLKAEFEKDYFKELTEFVRGAYSSCTVYPPPKDIFKAFDLCPFDKVEVVILGQDPYHGPRQANGLCFSVHEDVQNPPSLQNIYKEITSDLGHPPQNSNGDLSYWATQGVLLLNATLTVEAAKAGSHQHKGWEEFTDAAIKALSENKEHLVFLLWGRYAQEKGKIIDNSKHLVLKSVHPSPLSAYGGFFGCKHFSQANNYLKEHGKKEVQW